MLQISGEKCCSEKRNMQQRWLLVAVKHKGAGAEKYSETREMCNVLYAMETAVKNKCAMERVLQ